MAQSIKDAVLPLKQAAEDRARSTIVDLIDKMHADLAAVGNDVNKYVPIPSSGVGRKEYHIRQARRQFVESITKYTGPSSRRPGDPYIRVPSPEGVARAVQSCIEAAT